jgi:DNA-directed RNA polymerase subunit M/transcription elongation factor TFIIS
MERSCYNAAINMCTLEGIDAKFTTKKFVNRYSSITSRIISNIGIYFLNLIIEGKIKPENVASMTSTELDPSASQHIIDEIKLRSNIRREIKVSTLYICSKCKKNETIFVEYQGRAVDECSNLAIRCIHCQNTWKR